MYDITKLRTFSQEELLYLLNACASHLAYAYDEIQMDSLQTMAFEASMAAEYLKCEIARQDRHYQFH